MNEIRLTGSVELAAAAADGKVPTFTMLAYSGGPMKLAGFGVPVVVDAKGVSWPTMPAILRDHSPERIVGHADKIDANKKTGEILVEGVISGSGPDAAEVVASAAKGFPWQASIGATVERSEYIEAGAKATVNGRTITGPLQVVRAATLREISFVAVGADAATSAAIAASQSAGGGKGSRMDTFDQWLAASGFDAAALTESQRTALQAAYDAQRPPAKGNEHGTPATAAEVAAILAKYDAGNPEVVAATRGAQAIGATARQTELAALLASRGTGAPNFIGTGRSGPDRGDVLTASLLSGLGTPLNVIASHYGERVANEATRPGNRSLGVQGLLRSVIRAAGGHVNEGRLTDGDIRAAFTASQRLEASGYSTVSVPNILGNAAHKMLLQSFANTATTWSKFARRGVNANFKEHARYRMTAEGQFLEVAPAGEIKHVTLTEESQTSTLKTHGALIALTRRDIINDDLSAFSQIPRLLGRMSAIAIEKAVFTALLGNAGSFFASGNKNYSSGGGSALAAAGLNTALGKFRDQTDDNGDPIFLEPSILLVPPALESTAKALMESTLNVATTTANTPLPASNPYAQLAEVVVAPYLSTAFGLTNASNAGWYLLCAPGDYSVVEVASLNGMDAPTVESAEMDFNTLGIQMRAYHDFGVSLAEHRGGVFSVGS